MMKKKKRKKKRKKNKKKKKKKEKKKKKNKKENMEAGRKSYFSFYWFCLQRKTSERIAAPVLFLLKTITYLSCYRPWLTPFRRIDFCQQQVTISFLLRSFSYVNHQLAGAVGHNICIARSLTCTVYTSAKHEKSHLFRHSFRVIRCAPRHHL